MLHKFEECLLVLNVDDRSLQHPEYHSALVWVVVGLKGFGVVVAVEVAIADGDTAPAIAFDVSFVVAVATVAVEVIAFVNVCGTDPVQREELASFFFAASDHYRPPHLPLKDPPAVLGFEYPTACSMVPRDG